MKALASAFTAAALFQSLVDAASSPSPSSAPTATTQVPWNGVTTYPTTVTRIWSRTLSDKAKASETAVTVQTVTMYEPWPTSPNPENFPYTLLQTAVTARDVYKATTDAQGQVSATGPPLTVTPARTVTVTSTWVLWNTSPTDLAVGEKPAGCKHSNPHNDQKCATPNLKQDTRCLEHGLTTACHSQCKIRRVEGMELWWCQKRGDGTSKTGDAGGTREVAIGRVCTDSMGYYKQLLEPCDTMDHVHDCQPCNG